ncbi:phenylacetate-CoA ligase [Streptomyces netropsis]|uniref:Phenylacetate-CoA ligase n=2 Tax=Streptomyces netropsis TaxID=55404 RepID=A0A7W7LG69_STRNE|nr:phenylacetate-CoA ligase [Streptomyces netropsis]
MTPRLAEALAAGEAEFVLSTGTNHARMQIIRPPYFLLNSYYRLWSEHPDIAHTWDQGCQRVSLTTVLATEHVARVNAKKRGADPDPVPALEERRLDARTLYLNLRLDPALWERDEVERMLAEIRTARQAHPQGWYHLDCSGYHLAHLVQKVNEWGLWDQFPQPASIIHAYEYTPVNVRRFLQRHFTCPIIDLFGSTELGYLYYSDRDGRYWPYLDQMNVELIPVAPGSQLFNLIVTSVRNPHMPLIRYRSGDCVRTLDGTPDPARISRFCGREKELLPAPHGPVAQGDLDDCVGGASSHVFLHQLRPAGDAEAVLRYTTFHGGPLEPAEAAALEHGVGELTGRRCRIEHRAHIAIGKSGKYAWLVNDL